MKKKKIKLTNTSKKKVSKKINSMKIKKKSTIYKIKGGTKKKIIVCFLE